MADAEGVQPVQDVAHEEEEIIDTSKMKGGTLNNGDVETIGVQEHEMSGAGDATASKEDAEDVNEVKPQVEEEKESVEDRPEMESQVEEQEEEGVEDKPEIRSQVEEQEKGSVENKPKTEPQVDKQEESIESKLENESKNYERTQVEEIIPGRKDEEKQDDEKKEEVKEEEDTVKEEEQDDDGWVDILGTGHLKKKELREGQGMDTRPERGQLVTIRSKGQLANGEEVDCHEEIQFVLGDGDVIQAWDLAVALMQLGEQALVFTKPRFAYGEVGRKDDIPPNTDITYELELLRVEDKPDIETLSPEECCQMVDKKREHGNDLYSRKDYSNAINSYSKALDILREIKPSSLSEDSKKAVDELKVKCYNNLAAAQLKVDAPNAALKSCNSVLELHPNNVKALFRKGKVLATQGEYKEAVSVMKEALNLEPANKTIHQELSKLTARQAEERQSEKELYQRMVGDMAKVSDIPEEPGQRRQWMYAISIGILATAVFIGAIFASQT